MSLVARKISTFSLIFLSIVLSSCVGLTSDDPQLVVHKKAINRSEFIEFYKEYNDGNYRVTKVGSLNKESYIEHPAIIRGDGIQVVIREPFEMGDFVISCYQEKNFFSRKRDDRAYAKCENIISRITQFVPTK